MEDVHLEEAVPRDEAGLKSVTAWISYLTEKDVASSCKVRTNLNETSNFKEFSGHREVPSTHTQARRLGQHADSPSSARPQRVRRWPLTAPPPPFPRLCCSPHPVKGVKRMFRNPKAFSRHFPAAGARGVHERVIVQYGDSAVLPSRSSLPGSLHLTKLNFTKVLLGRINSAPPCMPVRGRQLQAKVPPAQLPPTTPLPAPPPSQSAVASVSDRGLGI